MCFLDQDSNLKMLPMGAQNPLSAGNAKQRNAICFSPCSMDGCQHPKPKNPRLKEAQQLLCSALRREGSPGDAVLQLHPRAAQQNETQPCISAAIRARKSCETRLQNPAAKPAALQRTAQLGKGKQSHANALQTRRRGRVGGTGRSCQGAAM